MAKYRARPHMNHAGKPCVVIERKVFFSWWTVAMLECSSLSLPEGINTFEEVAEQALNFLNQKAKE